MNKRSHGCRSCLGLLATCLLAPVIPAVDCGVVELDFDLNGTHTSPNDDALVIMATRADLTTPDTTDRTATAHLYARLVNRKITVRIANATTNITNPCVRVRDDTLLNKEVWVAFEDGGVIRKLQLNVIVSGVPAVIGGGSISVVSGGVVGFAGIGDVDGDGTADTGVTFHRPSITADGVTVAAEAFGQLSRNPQLRGWSAVTLPGALNQNAARTLTGVVRFDGTTVNLQLGRIRRPSISNDGAYLVYEAEVPESSDGTKAGLLNGSQYGNDCTGKVWNIIRYQISSGTTEILSKVANDNFGDGTGRALPMDNIGCTNARITSFDPGSGTINYAVTWESHEHLIDHYNDATATEQDAIGTDKSGTSDMFRWIGLGPGTGYVYRVTGSKTNSFSDPMASDNGRAVVGVRYGYNGNHFTWNVLSHLDTNLDYYRSNGDTTEALCSGPDNGDLPDVVFPPAVGPQGRVAVVHTRCWAGLAATEFGDGNPAIADDTNAIEDFFVVAIDNSVTSLLQDNSGAAVPRLLASLANGL
jgi:hypothetical protein